MDYPTAKNDLNERLEKLKESVTKDLEVSECICVELGYYDSKDIIQFMTSAAYAYTVNEAPKSYSVTVEKAKKFLDDVEKKDRLVQSSLFRVVDEVLGLENHPTVQSYKLAGARVDMKSPGSNDKVWFLELTAPTKEKPLRIVFKDKMV